MADALASRRRLREERRVWMDANAPANVGSGLVSCTDKIECMTRFGPLHSLTPALLVGDPTRRHLSLKREGIQYIVEGRTVETYRWQELNRIDTYFPSTWFRYPGAIAGVAMSLIALLTHDTPDFRAKPGNAKVTHDGEETNLPIDTHHLIGYWHGTVIATQRLLDRLVLDAPSRGLLNNPDALVKTVAASKRWNR